MRKELEEKLIKRWRSWFNVTGDVRHIDLPTLAPAPPNNDVSKDAASGAIDVFLPVIPGSKGRMGNSLSLNGEFASGYGGADMYTGLTGGVTFPNAPATWTQDIDNGIATFAANGALEFIQWTSYLLGAQYYLPGLDGRMWV